MKRLICLIIALLIFSCGCSHTAQPNRSPTDTSSNEQLFTINENENIVSPSGVEYSLLANEWLLCYLGDLDFLGSIQGEEKTSQHLELTYQTGMFKIKDADNDNILIRYAPNNEWCSIYRKTSLSDFALSVDNCIRLEFIPGIGNEIDDAIHTTCGEGISNQAEISEFLSEIRAQKDPDEAGLYDLVKKPNGMLENCYLYGIVYGFFKEEPNLAVRMEIRSYNNLAYSISIDDKEYVLPTEWLQKLENK